jgi:DNA polymerase III subunit delta
MIKMKRNFLQIFSYTRAVIIVLTGNNAFARRAELDKLVSDFVTEYSDMGLERLDGGEVEFQQIYDALTSLPFLASKKMVLLRNPSANKQFLEDFEKLLTDLPEITEVIIVEPKLDKRLSYYKFLKKATDFREFNELDEFGLARWLGERAKAKDGNLSQNDARYLVERVGASQQLLSSELDKLLLYDPNISRAAIDDLTELAPQSTIFNLLEAAFAGDAQRAMTLYKEQRVLKVEPPQIIAMLAWQLHVLAIIKTAGNRSAEDIAREAKLNPFVVRKSMGIAHNITLANLKALITDLLKIDVKSKTTTFNTDEALQHYLLQLSNMYT